VPTNGIFDTTISLLARSLDFRSLNHRVLASNIANMDTPNFKAFELVFTEEMNRYAESGAKIPFVRTHANHLPGKTQSSNQVRLKTAKAPDFSLRGDGNTVDIERTMGNLAENTLLYNTAVQLIAKKFNGLKNVIKGGSR
jgi:flagellar basal-body rod protein FlgB